MYSPRAEKDWLPFGSAHSKTMKRAIGTHCLQGALARSCAHLLHESLINQVTTEKDDESWVSYYNNYHCGRKLLWKLKAGPGLAVQKK